MNTKSMKEIIAVFEASTLSKMELEADDMKIKMEKAVGIPQEVAYVQQAAPQTIPTVAQTPLVPIEKEEVKGVWVKAPIVGTFYISRAIGSTPFIEIGKKIKKGDILCIIEAMKVMNEIHSPVDGVIAEILVTNESMVEFDQELIRIGEDHD